jgi:hypothetical protein
MLGHLLLHSSADDDAGECPTREALILLGIERLNAPAYVVSGTRCVERDTEQQNKIRIRVMPSGIPLLTHDDCAFKALE